LKDEKAIDWREGFSQLPLDKANKLKEGNGKFWRKNKIILFFWEKKENECVRGELIFYV
jgi:hypothetical protein